MTEVRMGYKRTEIGEIPVEWEVKRIMDIAEVFRGASPRPKGDPRYYGGDVPRLMVADVTRDYKHVTPKIDFLTEAGAKLSRPMPAGSLVVVCSGTVGVPAILAVDACIHDGFLGLKNISNDCDKEFLFYCFSFLRTKFDSAATHGGVFTNLTTTIMSEFTIAVPPIGEQRKIVAILSSVDKAIEKIEAIIEQTEKVKKGLMQQILTKGIGHTKFKKTEIGEIPEEWSICRLEDVTTRIGDGIHATPKYDSQGEIPFVNGNNIKNRELFIPIDNKRINEDEYNSYKQYLNENTIFLSINGTIGNLGFYNGEKVLLGKSIAYINPSHKLLREYLFYCLASHKVQNYFFRELTGTTIKNLSLKTIRDTLIPVPTIDEQKRISSILTNIDDKVDIHKEELAKLLMLKKGLMQSLLTGKVRVKVDEAEVTQV